MFRNQKFSHVRDTFLRQHVVEILWKPMKDLDLHTVVPKKRFVCVNNPYLDSMDEDILYHLDLGTKTHNLPAMFGDVKFVCVGRSPNRMKAFALLMCKELSDWGRRERHLCWDGQKPYGQSRLMLAVSHGMGIPSMSITLHELIELLYHTQCYDVTIIRIGTSGGIGITPGSVIITDTAVDSFFKPRFEQIILDNVVTYNTELDKELAEELFNCSKEIPNFPAHIGYTMCTYDFYEAAVVCVTLLDRLDCAQINLPHEVLVEYQQQPQLLIANFIKQRLGLHDQTS